MRARSYPGCDGLAVRTRAAGGVSLAAQEVDVWRAPLDLEREETVMWLESLLAPDELDRARRFYFARDRRRYVVCRGILRAILGRYLGEQPEELVFAYGRNGKPRLADGGLHFNVAHSEGLALLAFTRAGEVGVDLERIRPLPDCEEVARAAFPPEELARLEACPPERRREEFFRTWTRQEAVLKALGSGLGDAHGTDAARAFAVHPLAVGDGFAGALAVPAPARPPRVLRAWDGAEAGGTGNDFNFK